MVGPREILFSVQLEPHFPFLSRLARTKAALSDRLSPTIFCRRTGELVKIVQAKRRRWWRDSPFDADTIHAMQIEDPDHGFLAIRSPPWRSALWPPGQWCRGYNWVWSEDLQVLGASEEASCFQLTVGEARALAYALADALRKSTNGGSVQGRQGRPLRRRPCFRATCAHP